MRAAKGDRSLGASTPRIRASSREPRVARRRARRRTPPRTVSGDRSSWEASAANWRCAANERSRRSTIGRTPAPRRPISSEPDGRPARAVRSPAATRSATSATRPSGRSPTVVTTKTIPSATQQGDRADREQRASAATRSSRRPRRGRPRAGRRRSASRSSRLRSLRRPRDHVRRRCPLPFPFPFPLPLPRRSTRGSGRVRRRSVSRPVGLGHDEEPRRTSAATSALAGPTLVTPIAVHGGRTDGRPRSSRARDRRLAPFGSVASVVPCGSRITTAVCWPPRIASEVRGGEARDRRVARARARRGDEAGLDLEPRGRVVDEALARRGR